jgi:hypothetical protein
MVNESMVPFTCKTNVFLEQIFLCFLCNIKSTLDQALVEIKFVKSIVKSFFYFREYNIRGYLIDYESRFFTVIHIV